MKRSLSSEATRELAARLAKANIDFARQYPGESDRRQPVHTVYGGAHLFKADLARKLGRAARSTLGEYAPDFSVFAKAIGLPGAERLPGSRKQVAALAARAAAHPDKLRRESKPVWLAHAIYTRVLRKLDREPVEDFRIDFEDGYGNRPDAEEDRHAALAAEEVARGMASGELPPFIGIRVKPLSEELRERSFRTLDIFLTALVGGARGKLPENFVVTLPKVTAPEQVAALADVLKLIEPATGLARGSLKMELMVETTQAILNDRGELNLPHLVEAARGRCVAAHFGTYDYTASYSITATHQAMRHPACDFAKHAMKVALAGTGVWLCDGATNILPVAPDRPTKEGARLTPRQVKENREVVHRAWKLHYDDIQHSLVNAYYQGWDLHPAQLPTRYAAVYAFFLDALEAASQRLRNLVEKAAQATLVGAVFDDAATGQGLLNFFLRALNCGAITEREAQQLTSLALAELRSGSFVKILKDRTA